MKTPADMVLGIANKTVICESRTNTHTPNIWNGDPLQSAFSLLLLQISIISLLSHLINYFFKPLGQSSIVSQIFGGIIFGPSVLGHMESVSSTLFPPRGTIVLETVATFGIMFFLFSIAVKMDPNSVIRPGRKALVIGVTSFFFTSTLTVSMSLFLKKYLPADTNIAQSLPLIASSQSFNGFPVVAFLLAELKFLNTEIGRLALTSAMVSDVLGTTLAAIVFCITGLGKGSDMKMLLMLINAFALVGGIVYIIRPFILWMRDRIEVGKPVDEIYIFVIFILVLVVGLLSEVVGQHYFLGPVVLGLVVPDGPPLGAALVSKIDTLVSGMLYPTFLAISGLKTNLFKLHFQAVWIVGVIVVFAVIVKIGSTMVPAMYHDIPVQDALVLGLILNAKGILPLNLFNLWKGEKLLEDEDFTLSVLAVMAVTSFIAPMIKLLYNPSRQYISLKRSTIQHSRRDTEFRILTCIHNHDNVPSIINLLDLSHATEISPVTVIAMVIVELVGRTTPVLVSHENSKSLATSSSTSSHILNAFRHYEKLNDGLVNVESFTSISHFETIHDDICNIALKKNVALVIVPYHKQWAIDGSIGTINGAIKKMNINVIRKAPCSVGILIDKGVLRGSVSILNNQSVYNVAVIFLGGADDMESVAYGARMSRHEDVNVTVIRFLLFGSENSKDRKRDSDFMDKYRRENLGNPGFTYVEEMVRDGEGLSECIKKLADCFDFIIVGKNHDDSPLLIGLNEWSECWELGVLGDMMASPDMRSTASVLVVQQQRLAGTKLAGVGSQQHGSDKYDLVHDMPKIHNRRFADSSRDDDLNSPSWAISMDKYDRL